MSLTGVPFDQEISQFLLPGLSYKSGGNRDGPGSPYRGHPLARPGQGPGDHLFCPRWLHVRAEGSAHLGLDSCHSGDASLIREAGIPQWPDGAPQMCWGGYQVPSAQTRPHTEREEGCDFGVFRSLGGSPEKPERGPGLWQCARPVPGNPGCRSEEQRTQPSLVSEQSETLGRPLPLGLSFPLCTEPEQAAPSKP